MRGIETGRCLCSSRRGSGSSRRMVLKAANHVERVRLGQGNTFCIVGTTWQTGIASPVNACMGLTCQVPTALHHDMAHAPPHLLHPLQSYKMLAPPSVGQVLWQGGMLVFEGPTLLWAHADPSTAAHADLEQVVAVATRGVRPQA